MMPPNELDTSGPGGSKGCVLWDILGSSACGPGRLSPIGGSGSRSPPDSSSRLEYQFLQSIAVRPSWTAHLSMLVGGPGGLSFLRRYSGNTWHCRSARFALRKLCGTGPKLTHGPPNQASNDPCSQTSRISRSVLVRCNHGTGRIA